MDIYVTGSNSRMLSSILFTYLIGRHVDFHIMTFSFGEYIGKQDDKEVDFVALRREEKIYVKVTYQLASQATIDREFAPLLAINDHYPKYVVSMDEMWQDNIEGVRHKHISEFFVE